MIALHSLISFLIWLLITMPVKVVSVPVVAVLLLTSWDGRNTVFGNRTYGRGTNHPDHGTQGKYWLEFNWLVLRNPCWNLDNEVLCLGKGEYTASGDLGISDKHRGGFYSVRQGWAWEYYWIKPYGIKRCIRARIGWKLFNPDSTKAAFVFSVNPFKPFRVGTN